MPRSPILPSLLVLAMAAPAFAQVPADTMTVLRDAATFEGGAHFDSTLRLVARNTQGGADAVVAALAEDSPELAARARATLGLPEPAAGAPVQTVEAAQAAPDAGEEGDIQPLPEDERRGVVDGFVHALTSPPQDDPLWRGRLRVGLRWDDGNSDQTDYSVGFDIERDLRVWGLEAGVDYSYSKANGRVSRDRLNADARLERELGERWTAFGQAEAERDRLSSYDLTAFAGAGIGYRLAENDTLRWTVRVAPGVRYQQPVTGPEEAGLGLDLGSDLDWKISDRVTLGSDTSFTLAESSRAEQVFSTTTRVGGGWGAEARYRYRYEVEPRPGFQRDDSRLDISLIKEF